MAEKSEILPFQDADGDGLIDICKDVIAVPDPKECPECIPNPNAIVPDWRKRTRFEPFLNEKICHHQVTIIAKKYDNTGLTDPENATEEEALAALTDIFDEYFEMAIKGMLKTYNKDDSEDSLNTIKEVVEYKKFWLPPRPKSRLKLLYSVPYEYIEDLPERDEDEEEEETGPIEVTFAALEMPPMMMRMRKTLKLYNRYRNVYMGTDGGNIVFTKDNSTFPLENYGDWGVIAGSTMAEVLPALDSFLGNFGFTLPGVGNVFSAKDKLTEITFTFSDEYKLKKMSFYTEECGGKPIEYYSDGKLEILNAQPAWKDSTAMAYLANLREFDTAINARVAPYWIDVLKDYTYPEVYETVTLTNDSTAGSCVMEALHNEAKQLGQDILSDVFSIGDAIAYKFHQQLCKASLGEATQEFKEFGIYYDPVTGVGTNIMDLAKMQAFQTLEDQDQIFVSLCASLLNIGGTEDSQQMLDALWADGLDDLKFCGLSSLIMEVLTCLMGGLTFEEAMAGIVEAALRGMNINNFGDLFIGLPPDKQAELDELVKKKLEEGDVFKDSSSLQAYSDSIASTGETGTENEEFWSKPWEDGGLSEHWKERRSTGYVTHEEQQDASASSANTRTLVQQLDVGSEENRGQLSSGIVMEAYIKALLEVYQDNLLELVDELNKFPGAQLIANTIALLDCPRPAFFNPSVMDFIKDIELPFCRDLDDLSFPKLVNPFGWLPKFMDIIKFLIDAIMSALQALVIKIIIRLIVKICDLLAGALCNALEVVGDLAASLPDLVTGRENLGNVIKEAICGEDADDNMVDATIVDMVASLGVGGAALADTEQTLAFASDVSGALTETELNQMLLGEASEDAKEIVYQIVDSQYPDFADALPNRRAVGSLFKNMGNLMPAPFRDQLRNGLQNPPAKEQPANPSLCATPGQIEAFKELRCELLAGRATSEQCDQMFEDMRDQMKEDIGTMAGALNLPEFIENNMPPLVSDPGCDNGLAPFEPEVAVQVATTALGNELEQLKVDYSTDMIGNGPGERSWGLINMILSDTKAHPLSAHMRKVNNRKDWVDFYIPDGSDESNFFGDEIKKISLTANVLSALMGSDPSPYDDQRAAYPSRVAEYLRKDMEDKGSSVTVNLGNDPTGTSEYANAGTDWGADDYWPDFDRYTYLDKNNMGTGGLFGGHIDLLKLPDEGYNVTYQVNADADGEALGLWAIEKGRKQDPDIILEYKDNSDGRYKGPTGDVYDSSISWTYGFDLLVYFSDLVEDEESGEVVNRPDDNMRIKIVEKFNQASVSYLELKSMMTKEQWKDFKDDRAESKDDILYDDRYEFMGVDNTLAGIQIAMGNFDTKPANTRFPDKPTLFEMLDNYPAFLNTFQNKNTYQPQTVLLDEMVQFLNGTSMGYDTAKSWRESTTANALQMIFAEVANNTGSWAYGAKYDSLSSTDIEYGFNEGGEWISYGDYEITESDGGTRSLRNRDMRLGISYNQYVNEVNETPEETRVFYLDPNTYGGNYMNPPIFIKPLKNEGWLGMVDVLFPDLSPCKPHTTDLVDFGQIKEIIDDVYPNIPEDERLQSDPDCVIEKPYNRILMRPAKAGLVGLLKASIRIFASAHFVKTLPVFTTFGPKFPQTYSATYASYIIDKMEETFKDARGPDWVMFNLFSDHEFWYAFLEQSVQIYSLMVDEGKIDPPPDVLEALFRLNDLQEEYDYPFKEDLKEAKELDQAPRFQTLRSYRQDKNLEAVRMSEEDAKLVMKEFVIEELNYLAVKFMSNLKNVNLAPKHHDLDYYIMENLTSNNTLTLNSAVKPNSSFESSYVDIETEEGDEYYTSGSQFVVGEDIDQEGLEKGEEYIGYYNIQINEDGLPVWRAGEFYTEDAPQDLLNPMVNNIIVPIGDVADFDTSDDSQPFFLEKYISVDGDRQTVASGVSTVKNVDDLNQLISEVYPGTLKIVYDEDGNAVGLEGKLGVRYGLRFGVYVGGSKYEISAVELDALDTSIRSFETLDGDSKLLLCLINLMKRDEHFKLLVNYIIPMNKLTSIVAIYNDMAFLPSINQISVAENTSWATLWNRLSGEYPGDGKPGLTSVVTMDTSVVPMTVDSVVEEQQDADGNYSAELEGTWSHYDDRNSFWSWGVLEYDDWDQEILINSTYRIKKLFRTYYNSRDFNPDDIGKAAGSAGPASIFFKRMRNALRPAPGKRLLPRYRRRRLVTNPFNANGELCEKED